GWPSYWYYMWSTSKALLFIRNSGIAAAPGNLTGNSMGILPAADAPACNQRQLHRDPAADSRIPLFGAGGAGYYLGQPKDFYYDFAYEVMRRQQASGQYTDAFGSSSWNTYSRQAYALLILQRSVGGGCIDSDQDGICDTDEGGGEEPVQALYCDADFDGIIEYSDIAAIGKLINGTYKMAIPLTPQNEWANYANAGASATVIDANDYWQCAYVRAGQRPLKYYETFED
ncbi:MAG: hypothetical protein NDI84_12820, partial [Steroidobacteraceae bacterium]|nr:hypothetical protein [Steroidobacteraceae bacterium]